MSTPTPTHPAGLDESALSSLVQAEQVRLLYRQLSASSTGIVAAVLVTVVVLWPVAPHHMLMAWAGCVVALQVWRLFLYFRYDRAPPQGELAVQRWANLWAIGSAISGMLWGAAALLLFVPDSPVNQAFLVALIVSITSAGLLLIGVHLPSFYAFILPAMIPLMLRNFVEATVFNVTLGFISLVVTLALISFGRRYHRVLIESLRNRFVNEAMTQRFLAQNEELAREREAADAARTVAEAANRARTQFFAAANHDLRQPLHAMGLLAGSLVEKVKDPDLVALVNTISASMEALEGLFNELLDMSRLDSGTVVPAPAHFSMTQLFDKLRLESEPEAADKGLVLRFRSHGEFVFSDPLLMERILRNLLSNAIRYTREGGILVACRPRGGALSVEVWDTGPGIPDDQRERIFDEFVQLSNPERDRRKGLGLGLSIVRRLCALLGLELRVSSRVGRGSVFRVRVPLGREPPPVQRQRSEPRSDPTKLAGKHVVVIDDDPEIRTAMKALLDGWTMRVDTFANAAEALDATSPSSSADLIIADYRLPGDIDGIATIDALRARWSKDVPAILLTGSTSTEFVAIAQRKGFHYLLKPVMPAKLRTLVSFKLKDTASGLPSHATGAVD